MRFSRTLAVAAAVAVTAPVTLLTAAPALAAGTSAGQVQQQPTYAELVKAAADAKKAYEEAVIAKEEGQKEAKATLKALESDTHPLKAATIAADKAAKEAADVTEAAEQAVADAEAELEAAQDDAEKAEAQQALEAAREELAKAVTAQQEADAEAEKAGTALINARVAAGREHTLFQVALEKADKARKAAEEALATAKKCVRENGLTSLAVGLPSKVVAGTTVDFTLRVTNGTDRTLTVDPLVFFHVEGEQRDAKSVLEVKWSDGSDWQTLNGDEPEHIAHIDSIEPGERNDVKLRMKVDSVAEATDAFALFAGDAQSAYNPCVLGPMKRYDFKLLPVGSETGPAEEAEPGPAGENEDKRPETTKPGTDKGPSAQGGVTKQTVTTGAGVGGSLARTGTSSAMAPLALTSALTAVLGAGAVLAARRRRTTDNA
ncbi:MULTISPECIES: hypothetical protein [unclassified Streptomyces]|uniref:hypothetical protein n=1 Tax=unclassified Streptomyces TaxID=2593676 RepID=UPI0009404310|nr:hypothetical protein [Streptomyces sp. CB02400]OKK10288.1 hypothetical protein AMK33_15295 [Streptomyces sp. CB02400]